MHVTARQERRRWPWLLGIGAIALLSVSCADGSEEIGVAASTTAVTTGVRGVVAVSPSCAALAVDQTCPETPVPEAKVVVRSPGTDRSRGVSVNGAVATVTAGRDGTFSVLLPPGDYVVVAEAKSIPRCEGVAVRIPSTGFAEVHVLCDSGIR